jgi:hypothetical protein
MIAAMKTRSLVCGAVAAACMGTSWVAWAQAPAPPTGNVPTPEPTRGRLLYETHCIACHTSQMHWRDKRVVGDWVALVAQVRRWQERANLQWSEADVLEVARHLNATIYRLPQAVRG